MSDKSRNTKLGQCRKASANPAEVVFPHLVAIRSRRGNAGKSSPVLRSVLDCLNANKAE